MKFRWKEYLIAGGPNGEMGLSRGRKLQYFEPVVYRLSSDRGLAEHNARFTGEPLVVGKWIDAPTVAASEADVEYEKSL